jgi:hypothetical protein
MSAHRVTYRQHAGTPGGFVAIKFDITKTMTKEPNSCTLKVFNLAERTP